MNESTTQSIVPSFSKLTLNSPPLFNGELKENIHFNQGLFNVAPKAQDDRTPLTDKNQMSDISFDIETQEDCNKVDYAMKNVSLNLMKNFGNMPPRPSDELHENFDDPATPIGRKELRSSNMRERCLRQDKMGHFAFNLPLPVVEASSPQNDHSNPFKEINKITRFPSEMDLSNYLVRADSSVQTPLNYSRSPLVMMHNSSAAENFSEVSDIMEMPSISKKDSVCSVSFVDYESRFEKEFEVISELGKGYFGLIKKCRNRLDGLEYAVKITKHKWKGERGKFEALQEVFALSALSVCDDNPYIVKYFNGWIEDSKLYIVVLVECKG
jgi:hypothetical protein